MPEHVANLTQPIRPTSPRVHQVTDYGVRLWPKAAIIGIRPKRQLSEDKLPSAAIVHDGRR
jgi:hypothetical protein